MMRTSLLKLSKLRELDAYKGDMDDVLQILGMKRKEKNMSVQSIRCIYGTVILC